MSLPTLQLQPISTSHYYVNGDVTIQAGVAIAPGVLLQADANSRIIVKTGACIGLGAILHAQNGVVEVGEGANIGAEVLLIGHVTIGANACIGTATTVLNSVVAWGQIIPPGSLIGDTSRSPNPELEAEALQVTDTVIYPTPAISGTTPAPPEPPGALEPLSDDSQAAQNSGINVYGQVYVNKMLVKLFPHRQPPSTAEPSSDRPATDDPWAD
ncbi:hypothetical protein [Pantanalinema sp. GBBB05]|uniref:hypothetical protein n=1 Tax=Pantanalinema sp. GBBB05 TaxID=2604139 RepID=UPI001D88ABEA|nr:hypothetical protein [Pantanalinema sp. GBBB05]